MAVLLELDCDSCEAIGIWRASAQICRFAPGSSASLMWSGIHKDKQVDGERDGVRRRHFDSVVESGMPRP
jgi:hypothetical protein